MPFSQNVKTKPKDPNLWIAMGRALDSNTDEKRHTLTKTCPNKEENMARFTDNLLE